MKKSLLIFLLPLSLNAYISVENVHSITRIPTHKIQKYLQFLKEMEESNEAQSNWGGYYRVFSNLIETMNLKAGVEVGVSSGGHSNALLKNTSIDRLYSIDPWQPDHCTKLEPELYEVFYLRVKARLSAYGNRSEVIRGWGEAPEVLGRFSSQSLDFVFLDGSHLYEDVLRDIELWYEKLRSGGLIGGDDYVTVWPGVKKAVDEFFYKKGLKVNQDPQQPRIWWVVKP